MENNEDKINYLEEELRKVSKRLLNAEKVQSDFLSNIKNEINNPLTSILGLLQVVNGNPEDHQGNATVNKLVLKEVRQLNFQMKNILAAAEIEAGHAPLELSSFRPDNLLEEVLSSLEVLVAEKRLQVSRVLNTGADFTTDKQKFSIILANLLSNACKFSPDQGKIHVEMTVNEDKQLIVTIQDHGKGMDEQELRQIYDRFRQLDSGTRKAFGGHGLGLSVAQALTTLLNGVLRTESQPQAGTTFTLQLPNLSGSIENMVFYEDDEGILFGTEDEGEETF